MNNLKLATPLALAIVLGGLLSGCAAGQPQVTAAEVIQNMRDAMKNATSVQGTFDLNLTLNKDGLKTLTQGLASDLGSMGKAGGMTGSKGNMAGGKMLGAIDWSQIPDSVSATLNYWRQSPDKARVDVVTSSISQINGSSVVYDGQKVYALDAPNKTVYTLTPSKLADKIPANVKSMLANVDVAKDINTVISATNVTLVGTEKVGNIDAYKLDVTVKPDAATILGIPQAYAMPVGVLIKDLHATLDVEQDNWAPIKFTLDHPQMGSFSLTASKLDLNKSIDASTFVLQVPAGDKTVDLDQMHDQSTSTQITLPDAQAAAQKAGWTLLVPSYVPDNATLVGVTQMAAAKAGGFLLSYSSSASDFTILEGKTNLSGMDFMGAGGKGAGVGQNVTVRGVQAKAFSPAGSNSTILVWQEKDSGVWVAISGKFSVDEAVKVAEGLK